MPISTTTLNLTDVERWLKDESPAMRHCMAHVVESLITQEQLISELKVQMNKMVDVIAMDLHAKKVLKQQMDRIESRFDNTGNVSFDDPTKQ